MKYSPAQLFTYHQKWIYKNKMYIAVLFIIITVFLFYFYKSHISKESFSDKLSIINLVLYSKNNEYDEMYKITRKYYSKFHNVKTIYYRFNPDIHTDYELIDDILNIKGEETYVPGILDKTVKAFEYINKNYTFDYLVRSNISTIIEFDLLCDELRKNPINYGAGTKMVLNWLDPPSGIVDKTYFGTVYGSGTSIILSKDTLTNFLKKKEFTHYDVIDDVSIGLLVQEQLKQIKPQFTDINLFFSVPDVNGDANKLLPLIKNKPYVFYRNRQSSRQIDIAQMKIISDYLQTKK
jgi:hypothetical protein